MEYVQAWTTITGLELQLNDELESLHISKTGSLKRDNYLN